MTILRASVLLLLLSPPALAQQPDWVSGKSREYPEEFYLVGVGSGQSRDAAENSARANIGKIFKVDISEHIAVTRTETLERTDQGTTGRGGEKTVSTLDAGLIKTLEGTEIAEAWEDKAGGRFYALAVLEREKAEAILKGRIADLDSEIGTLKTSVEQSDDMVQTARLMFRSKALMETRDRLNADYRIVDPASKGIPAPFSLEKERTRIKKFLKDKFLIGVEGEGEQVDRVVQSAIKHLTARGFNPRKATAGNREQMHLLLSFEYTPEPLPDKVDDWYYCRWQLSMNAVDQGTGSVIVGDVAKGRAGQLSPSESKKKALSEAGKAVESLIESFTAALMEG